MLYILALAGNFFSQLPDNAISGDGVNLDNLDPKILSKILESANDLFDKIDPKQVESLLQNTDFNFGSASQFRGIHIKCMLCTYFQTGTF